MRFSNQRGVSPGRHRRPSTLALWLFLPALALTAASLLDARPGAHGTGSELVAELGLTDLALFTEARYTRHLSQADRHTPFQDHPLALDHFPSGSLVPPPARLRQP